MPSARLVIGLMAIGLLGPVAAAQASGVSVQSLGSEDPVLVSAEQIAGLADVGPTPYRLRDEDGVRTITRSGTRLATVLRAAGVDPAAVPTLELTRDDGSALYLTRRELDPPAGAPPLVSVAGGSVSFVRDSRGPGDLNVRDAFSSEPGTPIRVTVSPVAVLDVSVEASAERVRPGRPVSFDATVGGALPGETLRYEWRFGDGSSADGGERIRHRFRARGRYEVVLSVTGTERSGGSSEPVVVQVGRPLPGSPAREGGGRATEGAPPGTAAPGGGAAGPGANGEPGTNPAPGAAAPGLAPADPAAPEPAPDPPASEPADPEPAASRGRPERERRTPRETSGTPVRGLLLGRSASAAAPARSAVGAAPAVQSGRATSSDPKLGVAAGALATLALVGWGAAGEWRSLRRRRRRR